MAARAGDPAASAELARILAGSGVAIIPCDTIYGLVGAAPATEQRIRDIKGRGDDKPFLQLIPDASWVSRLSDAEVPATLSKYWPGPLTIIIPARGSGTVALRVPDSPFLRNLILEVGRPLYSTSVNRTGQAPTNEIDDITREFESEVDMILDAGRLPDALPSTLVDATARPYRVLRQGTLHLNPEDLR